ncbi:S-adenosylmethionine--2-demethylmenaquinone methyltransferase [Mesorhizobium sp. VK4C]|uniref:RraA family protein n=1 Tax=Mesorhizobium captivum TaxID=3072319 RepID=UPI002A23E251|nr:S-adenosylmethionine--2-demethylmenaquinone methyltransferase [Mesorhizobium sp. VK4C]MDX8500660.1 S-adenosylmethionine--2-demethylmenaquinone methyltransferase [Mesorhizobium sp. VK4C]
MKTADLVDAHGDAVRFCDLPFLKLGKLRSFHGPITTVKCFEDNALLKAELQKPGKGRVMVAVAHGPVDHDPCPAIVSQDHRYLVAEQSAAGGTAALDGEIDEMDVAVFCLGVSPTKSSKDGAGKAGAVLHFGDVEFRPGAFAYADPDELLVSAVKA